MSGHNGSAAGIVLVLFILLVIILIASWGSGYSTSVVFRGTTFTGFSPALTRDNPCG
ncbi:hypothetical protein VQL36_08760 [Chengkuizengella sp. SCS-71B]|uniref:hypothetical protein n=1 Tax=Chengkuizengella sp. SCS-71B TaxID=3115290 RepID=UPI0032C21749